MGLFTKTDLAKNYTIGATLGSGNFATVKKGTPKDKTKVISATGRTIPPLVAIKVIDKSKVEDMKDIQTEIDILFQMSHPNIIALFEIYDSPKHMNLVMELVTGGELFDRIVEVGSYTEREAASTMKILCEALNYLHDKGIVHRDLKPENILLKNKEELDSLTVADFGLARCMSETDLMQTACGTPGYVAPEVLKNMGYNGGACDMWSAGVILYILLCGFPPFYEEELPALFEQILHARYDFPSPWWDSISAPAKDLVAKLLVTDPDERLTADKVLAHPWVVGLEKDGDVPSVPLNHMVDSLKKYNALRKVRKIARGIIAQNKLNDAVTALRTKKTRTKA